MPKFMFLTIKDRIAIPTLLPSAFSVSEWRVKNSIINTLKFSEKEVTDFEIIANANQVNWNPAFSDLRVRFNISEEEHELIKVSCMDADKKKELNDLTVEIASYIIEGNPTVYEAPRIMEAAAEPRPVPMDAQQVQEVHQIVHADETASDNPAIPEA